MKKFQYIICLAIAALAVACQPNMDVEPVAPQFEAPAEAGITGQLVGDDYVWTWTLPGNDVRMQVTTYTDGNKTGVALLEPGVVTYKHELIDTNVPFTFVFKYTDGNNYSEGTVKHYTRPGAGKMSDLNMEQLEVGEGYDARISWAENKTANKINLTIVETKSNTTKTEELAGNATEYLIRNVLKGESYTVTLVAENAEGKSLPVAASLAIGSTKLGFLSEWATPEEHIANADDDEATAWLWFHEAYPNGVFIPFASIADFNLDNFRVLFWIRDLETGNHMDCFSYSAAVEAATPAIEDWYMAGGSLLLWGHAATYMEKVGRIPEGIWLSNDNTIGTGVGGINNDTWCMGVGATPGDGKFVVDYSTHPLYRGLSDQMRPGGFGGMAKVLPVKGPGWTEDHNCCFFNWPGQLTGMGNQDPKIYETAWNLYGIRPLGTWDGQMNWIGQLIVWEAGPCANTPYLGTALCIANGGLEFSMKHEDGTPDVSAHPSVNAYQDNVLAVAKNAIEYLKTR